MTERDRIMDAFRNCITVPKCKNCPWDECDTLNNRTVEIPIDLALAVMRELKAQEPRVMTLEEVAAWHSIPESKRDPIYVEYRPNSGLGVPHWTIEYFGFNPNSYPNKNSGYYGKWLRCWTSRPTDEQREVVVWE